MLAFAIVASTAAAIGSTPARAQDGVEAEMIGYHQILIGRDEQGHADWRRAHADWWWWER